MAVLPQILPRSARVWPPAGGMASVREAVACWRASIEGGQGAGAESLFALLRKELAHLFGERQARFFCSGKAALEAGFRDLRMNGFTGPVVMGDYGCPDVASAAIRAGCRILPLDISRTSLDLLGPDALGPDEIRNGILVFTNLYGLADNVSAWESRIKECHLAVVDDACQAGLSVTSGARVGARVPGYSVLSFGRGKALYGVGGGALLSVASDSMSEPEVPEAKSGTSLFRDLDFYKARILEILEQPRFYGIPARMPFLGLGETAYYEDFPEGPLGAFAAAVALTQVRHAQESQRLLSVNAERWRELLSRLPLVLPEKEREANAQLGLLRYPILLPNVSVRGRIWVRLARAGLGASGSYPRPLHTYEPVQYAMGGVGTRVWPNAYLVSETVLTLPTHRFVTDEVFERTFQILKEEL